MKLGIGTVQFGLDYGVSNSDGITPLHEVRRILEIAAASGLSIIDTASMYGKSEVALGASWPEGHNFKVVTKTPRLTGPDAPDLLEQTFTRSLERLNVDSVYGLLVHHADDLLTENGPKILLRLQELRAQGLAVKIGVSVYNGAQIDAILDKFMPDIIQLPLNVFDQRLLASGHLSRLKNSGVEIHARSVFLQGLILMHPDRIPAFFEPVMPSISKFHEMLQSFGLSAVQGALGFVMSVPWVDTIVCGVNNSRHLKELFSALTIDTDIDFSGYAITAEQFVNPSLWSLQS